jgi:putative transposase
MPRRARLKLAGQPLHVYQRGVNRARCFSGIADRERYLALLAEQASRHGCAIHAYVLMSNHVHLLLTPATDNGVSRMMKAIGERYVRAFNKAHKRSGTLWEGRFKSSIVDTEKYLFTCYRHIEMNPVRAGMVTRPGEYPWSSYLINAEGADSDFVTPHKLFLGISQDSNERRRVYRSYFGTEVTSEDLTAIREAISGGFALGGPVLHGQVESHNGARSKRMRRIRAKDATGGLSPNKWSVP